jgi:hypothetical protein
VNGIGNTTIGNGKDTGGVGSETPVSIIFSETGAATTKNINSGNTALSNSRSQAMITETNSAQATQGKLWTGAGLTNSNTANTAKATSSAITKTATSTSTTSSSTTFRTSTTSTTTTTRPTCLTHECKLNVMCSARFHVFTNAILILNALHYSQATLLGQDGFLDGDLEFTYSAIFKTL